MMTLTPRITSFRNTVPPIGDLHRESCSRPQASRLHKERRADVLILGAGCAGTSLAHHLDRLGFGGKVVLLDNRRDFTQEQRWCLWSPVPASLQHLVSHSWNRWSVQDENCIAIQHSSDHSYQEIYAPHFFEHFHQQWRAGSNKSNIQVLTGEAVHEVRECDDDVLVSVGESKWRAPVVFDTRHGSSRLEQTKSRADIFLHQTFVGYVVEFARPVFDVSIVNLMDFRVPQQDGVRFMYVLPYSPTRALVESTSFAAGPLSFEQHEQILRDYLARQFGTDYNIRARENGVLPMTTAVPEYSKNARIVPLGVAGGCARPSSGYAFARIQRQTLSIAKTLRQQSNLQDDDIAQQFYVAQQVAPWRYSALDEVFLQALQRSPQFATDCFLRLFSQVKPDALVRFLSEQSTMRDDLQIISAMPKQTFVKAAIQRIAVRAGKNNRKK